MRCSLVSRLALIFTLALPLDAHADPPATAVARSILDGLGPSPCDEIAEQDLWSARISLVVHPDGAWSVALGPVEAPLPLAPARLDALGACAIAALSEHLPPTLPAPPRAATVLVREWRYPTNAERALLARFHSLRTPITACVHALHPDARGDVALTLRAPTAGPPDVRPRTLTPVARVVARCTAQALVMTPALAHPVDAVLTLSAPPATRDRPRADGTLGAVCGWGMPFSPDRDHLPAPAPCRAGLRCCPAGGAAGSGSVCTRYARCPAYP